MPDEPLGEARPSIGMLAGEATSLASAINKSPGWFAMLAPAWRPGERPLAPLYWVKCCYIGHPNQSAWHYLGDPSEWRTLRPKYPTV